jgi:hypothetical protein
MRTLSFPLICLLALSASCGEDGVARDPNPTDPGILPDGGGVNPDPSQGCPDSQPKVGENCSPGITESNRCDYSTGECVAPNGMTYSESISLCCTTGVWETCGGRSPCDIMGGTDVDAAAPSPPPDGGVLDALGDGSPEVHPDTSS